MAPPRSIRGPLFWVVLVLIAIVLYAIEITYHFGRYLQLNRLLAIGAAIGLLAGIGLAYGYRKRWTDGYDRMRFFIGLGIGGLLFGPWLLSSSNRLLDWHSPDTRMVTFVSADGRVKSRFGSAGGPSEPDSYATVVSIEGELFRFDTQDLLYPNASNGDQVPLRLQPGFWGLDYVVVEAE
jgi:hypothetical protein